MSYQKDRDEFVAVIVSEISALPGERPTDDLSGNRARAGADLARLILRNASTIQRCEELVCSSEAADRDRVACPGGNDWCLCRDYGSYDEEHHKHGRVPHVQVQIHAAQKRIEAACKPWGIKPMFSGDPRGACVKLLLPSGRFNSWGGKECFCVPTR